MKRKNSSVAVKAVLDEYFESLHPERMEGAVEEHKSTRDIQRALMSKMSIRGTSIISYMLKKGYRTVTGADDTIKWILWRTRENP